MTPGLSASPTITILISEIKKALGEDFKAKKEFNGYLLDAALNALSKVSILKDALMAHKKLCS